MSLCKGHGDHTWYQSHGLYWIGVKVNVMTSAINLTVITKLQASAPSCWELVESLFFHRASFCYIFSKAITLEWTTRASTNIDVLLPSVSNPLFFSYEQWRSLRSISAADKTNNTRKMSGLGRQSCYCNCRKKDKNWKKTAVALVISSTTKQKHTKKLTSQSLRKRELREFLWRN